jgi:hypothetical protein
MRGVEGFFFTNHPGEASFITEHQAWRPESRPNIMPVYLSLQNPLVRKSGGDVLGAGSDTPAVLLGVPGRQGRHANADEPEQLLPQRRFCVPGEC